MLPIIRLISDINMSNIKLFEDKKIRVVYDEEKVD